MTWTFVVCLVLIASTCQLLRQMNKHFAEHDRIFKSSRHRILVILFVFIFSYAYRMAFYLWYEIVIGINNAPKSPSFMITGMMMYIFGEGLPLVIIFSFHYYRFVLKDSKKAQLTVVDDDSEGTDLLNCTGNKSSQRALSSKYAAIEMESDTFNLSRENSNFADNLASVILLAPTRDTDSFVYSEQIRVSNYRESFAGKQIENSS